MPRKFKQKKGKNKVKPQKGDTYDYSVEITEADDNGDGVLDLVLDHTVHQNGRLFTSARIVWYGVDGATADGFGEAMEKAGIVEGKQTFVGFRPLVKEWRKLTKALHHINDLGDDFATELGED